MTNQINNQSIIPSTDVIQLTLSLKMTTAQVVETSVTVNNTVLFTTKFTQTIKLKLLLKKKHCPKLTIQLLQNQQYNCWHLNSFLYQVTLNSKCIKMQSVIHHIPVAASWIAPSSFLSPFPICFSSIMPSFEHTKIWVDL